MVFYMIRHEKAGFGRVASSAVGAGLGAIAGVGFGLEGGSVFSFL